MMRQHPMLSRFRTVLFEDEWLRVSRAWHDLFETAGITPQFPGKPGRTEPEVTARPASIDVPIGVWTPWSENNPHAFDTKSHRNVGPGEAKFAWEIGGDVHGSSAGTFDIIDKSGEMWEIKKITGRYATFRGGAHGRQAASRARDQIAAVCEILRNGIQTIEADMLSMLFEKNDGVTIRQVLKFLSDDVSAISAGELAKGRILGNTPSNPIGLLQILRAISSVTKKAKACPNDLKIVFAKKIRSIDAKTYVKIARAMGMSFDEMDIDRLTYLGCVFDHRAFREPDWFIEDAWFRTIRPSNVLGHVSKLVLVRKDEFFVIPRDELDEKLELVTVTKGDVKLRLSRMT